MHRVFVYFPILIELFLLYYFDWLFKVFVLFFKTFFYTRLSVYVLFVFSHWRLCTCLKHTASRLDVFYVWVCPIVYLKSFSEKECFVFLHGKEYGCWCPGFWLCLSQPFSMVQVHFPLALQTIFTTPAPASSLLCMLFTDPIRAPHQDLLKEPEPFLSPAWSWMPCVKAAVSLLAISKQTLSEKNMATKELQLIPVFVGPGTYFFLMLS